MKRLDVARAELNMRIGAFIAQNHDSALKRGLARFFIWANRRRYNADVLDFLEAEPSIDNFDYSDIDSEKSAQTNTEKSSGCG